ncbi:MAG: phosphonopyruvate decarboxylase [Ignavibacteria bacterium]|nr:phosphonopyruvate decarboxylase [Ignavibacteria bacterium]MBT8381482.1 phosphonopyruvate decarboxylase [Ignavibacteria bacterium]MBT8391544.1 phosphonopyruvate decarboxylase [Ignavibacteria bacterium]NNJ52236.1 phosphonopyruvate decarboxylase [Ignavibacteriaceae bacterium]NNL22713.1 phosphonopyruvate decarboxylase [Ignavibacteriaceae bacterium]
MIKANEFLDLCLKLGFNFFTGTPCSYLKPLINYVIDHKEFNFVDATNEGDAVAIASGVTIAGGRSVVMFQNSGLGNAVNPLTSLAYIFRVPLLIIVTHRGEPGGEKDEPQHELMGNITIEMLETMQISWAHFPNNIKEVEIVLNKADKYLKQESKPFALVMSKKNVESYTLQSSKEKHSFHSEFKQEEHFTVPYNQRHTRSEALKIINKVTGKDAAIIATTGYTGRELYEIEDRENQLYMVGSMGCALPLGFGMAITKPKLKIYVIDGDGALLMRTGTMATVGAHQPENLIHILLDNEVHESTGGQGTVSGGVSFSTIASGFGYKHTFSTDSLDAFEDLLSSASSKGGPTFIHFKIKKGTSGKLGRPVITPIQVKERLIKYLNKY